MLFVAMVCNFSSAYSETEFYVSSINTVKNDLRGEFQADLKKLSSIQAELMTEQQRQIQLLKEELFNIKSLLMETNCTEVKECVAEDLTQINHKLIADDIQILQNEAAINQIVDIDLRELHDDVDEERKQRTQKDSELQTNIDKEVEDLQTNIDAEASTRTQQDNVLQSNIDTEVSTRTQQDNVLQTNIDKINEKPRFAAEIRNPSGYDYLPDGDITDFTELADIGDIFNPTTGRLTINDEQQEGKYVLHISGNKFHYSGNRGYIIVYKNQEEVQRIFEEDKEYDLMINAVVTLHLQKDDEVKLSNLCDESIAVYSSYHPFTFTGYKI